MQFVQVHSVAPDQRTRRLSHLSLVHGVYDRILAQVGVHRAERDVLAEGAEAGEHPLRPGLGVHGDAGAGVDPEEAEAAAKVLGRLVDLRWER